MAIWTNIPNANLEAGAPVRSVDHLAMRDNDVFLKDQLNIVVVSTSATFTTSGTYTVPTLAEDDQLYVMMFGGGGSGAVSVTNTFGGVRTYVTGGGGNVGMAYLNKANLGATLTYTIGAGGAARTQAGGGRQDGNPGGSTSVFSNGNTLSLVGGGNAGTWNSNDESQTVSIQTFVEAYLPNLVLLNNNSINVSIPRTLLCSGRGAASDATVMLQPSALGGGSGGNSGGTLRTQNFVGAPATTYGGAGGTCGGNANGNAGSTPGGGGGGAISNILTTRISGAGAAGGVKFFIIKGIHDTQSVFSKVFTL